MAPGRNFGAAFTLGIFALCLASGCVNLGYVESTVCGRTVVATGGFLGSHAKMTSDFVTATVQVGGKTFRVAETELTWGEDQKVELPPPWQRMEFVQSGRQIKVFLDGLELAVIPCQP